MNATNLGRLCKIPLREVWSSESAGFTPWLAKEENLALLGEAIGLELDLEAVERDVGPFRADILCKDAANDSCVLIENQLERTDHSHLGQLLTYAAGLDAVTIVWIAERFTAEHRAVLDWLNERTDEHINLFGLEIELWRIGDSLVAPKFNVISQPNDWSRTVQKAAAGGDLSEHKQIQQRFWSAFAAFMEAESTIKCTKPLPQHWMNISIGRSGFNLSAVASLWNTVTDTKKPEIRAELVIHSGAAKSDFAAIAAKKAFIESELGFPLIWHNPEGKNMCRIFAQKDANFLDEDLWPVQFAWLREKLEAMHKVFAPIVKTLSP